VAPSFRIGISKKDSKILERIRKKFGCGGIYTIEKSKKSKNYQDVRQYYVQNHKDLFKVAEFFKKQRFYTTKKKDFELWCQILELIKQKRERTKEGFLEICKLRDQMNRMKGKVHKRSTRKIRAILENPPEYIVAHREIRKEEQKEEKETAKPTEKYSVVYITNAYAAKLKKLAELGGENQGIR